MNIRTAFALTALLAASASAHHAESAYDHSKVSSASGTVKEFLWANPHVLVYLEVADDRGHTDVDAFECGSAITMIRNGWSRKSLRVGDKLVVTYYPRRDARPGGMLLTATDARGRTLVWQTATTP